MTRRLVALLTATGLLTASVASTVALAARPSDSLVYAVQVTIEQTVTGPRNATGSPQTDPRQTCGRAAISMKLNASGKYYVAAPRSTSRPPVVATNSAFRGAYQGRHPSLPLKGQLAISTDLQEATAEECLGPQFPAEHCERVLPVRRMAFDPTATYWEINVKKPPLANVRCLDYVPLVEGGDLANILVGPGNYSLPRKMLRGKNFRLSGNVIQPWAQGTLRLTWKVTFTRLP